jgi:hypothetical protein
VLFQGATTVPRIFEALPHPGRATCQVRQCRTLQTITASFRILTASFYGVAIYTQSTPPGRAADIQNVANHNPFQSLVKLSLTPLFVRVSD